MTVNNTAKLAVALLGMVSGLAIVILCITNIVPTERYTEAIALGSNLILNPLWYIIGNGIAAKGGNDVQPIISQKGGSANG